MTQELTDLRSSILEGRYSDALAIADELEGMSKKEIRRKIKAFLRILVIHLIKNQVEKRLTKSWAASIRNSILGIQDLNVKENNTFYYVNSDEWEDLIEEEVIENAIADASEEVMNGQFNRSQLSEMLDKPLLFQIATQLLELTYTHSAKQLPALIEEHLVRLPGGEGWINRRN